MAEKNTWHYERLNEEGRVITAPVNDTEGKYTGGRIVYGVEAWLDENPEEARRLGWVKHITHSTKEIEYDRATQYLARQVRVIDDYTVEDVYHIMNKSAEMMRLEELRIDDWDVYDDEGTIVWR